MPRIDIHTGISVNYEISGEGDPLLLIMGTSGSLPLWGDFPQRLSETFQVITFDNRGMGETTRGDGAISVGSLAEDAAALLDALDITRAHVVGWSLGSAVAQELVLRHPEKVASTVLYATWAKCDGYQSALLTALRFPAAHGDIAASHGVGAIAFSPSLLDNPDLPQFLGKIGAGLPNTEEHLRVTTEQWDADLLHDTADRLATITTPSLVVVGEEDLLTPPRQAKKVADAIPGAAFELLSGPGSSHALHLERTDELVQAITQFCGGQPVG